MAEACGQNGKNKQISKSVSSSSSDGSLSIESSTISMPPAPDGGYGWIIVFSAFLTNMICDGIAFSFGVMYSELLDVFDASKSTTSWIASLFFGMPLIAGPLAGGLATKFGCRKVLIFGGILTSVGIFASAFADSIGMLCFSFGIVAGTGMSMGYVTSLVMVAFYFQKNEPLLQGLLSVDQELELFYLPHILEYLIEEYTWRGSFIILSGITLNLVVCGALLRPLEFTPEQEWQRNLEAFEKMSRSVSKASLPDHGRRSRKVSESDSSSSDSDEENYIGCEQLSHSQVILPTFLAEKKNKIPKEVFEEMCSNTDEALDILKNYFRTRGSSDVNIITNPIEEMLTVTSNDKIVIVKEDPMDQAKKVGISDKEASYLLSVIGGCNYVLSTLILVEFLGMDKLTNAYGLTMLIQGIANMIGPPVAGLLYDTSGSYNNTFYFSSMFIILAGFMLTTVPITKFLKRHLMSHGMSPDKHRRGSPEDITDHDMTRVQFLPKNIEISV
ncbi:ERI1 exoribonuclease 2 [Mytilus galloprovincialis]|uniref:ERI1 exoribonuclease 2 n=1 Tax=Mytilus galloprovincialis TaxID=29158 RepID=A0A8B6H4U9_MYTGA|nr:ERI1 exoribonuclease 2 [Mytilus galloprovincialis]